MKLHHVGYVVKDMNKSLSAFAMLFGEDTELKKIMPDKSRNVSIAFCGEGLVELVSPLDIEQPSPVDGYLKHSKVAPYHLCYEVDNLQEAIANLQANSFSLVKEPAPAPAINGRNVAFLYNMSVGLIELVECS